MSAQTTLYIAACAEDTAYIDFEETVRKGVPSQRLRQYTDADLDWTQDRIGVWGPDTGRWTDVEPGDHVLFYTDGKWVAVGTVAAPGEQNWELCKELWPAMDETDIDGGVLYFESVQELSIPLRLYAYETGYKLQYNPRQFGSPRDEALARLRERFGSLRNFTEAFASPAVYRVSIDESQRHHFTNTVEDEVAFRNPSLDGVDSTNSPSLIDSHGDSLVKPRFRSTRGSTPVGLQEVAAVFDTASVWYAPPGDAAYEELDPGDVVLFHTDGEYLKAGRVGRVCYSQQVTEELFGESSGCVYTLYDIADIELETTAQRAHVAHAQRDDTPGHLDPLSDDQLAALEQRYDSVERFLRIARGDTVDLIDDEWVTTRLAHYEDADGYGPYFAKQGNEAEVTGEYLDAPADRGGINDISNLEEGDLIFQFHDDAVCSVATPVAPAVEYPASTVNGDEPHHRVPVRSRQFETPVKYREFVAELLDPAVRDVTYYPLHDTGMNTGYLFQLTSVAGRRLFDKGTRDTSSLARLQDRLSLSTVTPTIPADLYFEDPDLLHAEITSALTAGKHIIFTGPPGTGKTELAEAVCEAGVAQAQSVDGYTFTTATAEWTTFDTIGGYVPDDLDGAQELRFDPRLFLDSFRDDSGDIHTQWLLIDELNRADIDKAFGPLFSVLSKDSVVLPYERDNQIRVDWVDEHTPPAEQQAIAADPDRFPVTPAWRLVGTMNTFDKTSLYDLSYAFMRRFRFIHVGVPSLTVGTTAEDEPIADRTLLDPTSGPNYATKWIAAGEIDSETVQQYHAPLSVVWAHVNQERAIGPSLVLDMLQQLEHMADLPDETALASVIVGQVFPQLEGMRTTNQESLISGLAGPVFISDGAGSQAELQLALDHEHLRAKATDMLGADFE